MKQIDSHILPKESGWYSATRSGRFHWFDESGVPLCGQVISKTNIYIHRFGSVCNWTFPPSVYTGHCPNCIKRLNKANEKK